MVSIKCTQQAALSTKPVCHTVVVSHKHTAITLQKDEFQAKSSTSVLCESASTDHSVRTLVLCEQT